MAIRSLKQKLESKNKRISSSKKQQPVKEKRGEPYEILDSNTTIFEDNSIFKNLSIDDFDFNFYMNAESSSNDEFDRNCEILMDCIQFLLKLKYQNISKYKMTKTSKAKLLTARSKYPNIVVLNQLYTMIPNNETFIDIQLQKLVNLLKIKIIPLEFETYTFDLVISTSDIIDLINHSLSYDSIVCDGLKRIIHDFPNLSKVTPDLIKKYRLDANVLLKAGFLTLSASQSGYNLTLPNIGPTLKMIRVGMNTITKICKNNKYNQALESEIVQKFCDISANGLATKTSAFVKTNGLDPLWILSIMVGFGLVECFRSPVGKAYTLTTRI